MVSASELNLNDVLALVTTDATRGIQVPVLTILGENDVPTCGPNTQGGNFDCSTGAAVAMQRKGPVLDPEDFSRVHNVVGVKRLLDCAHYANGLAVLGDQRVEFTAADAVLACARAVE